ncbi:response regulator transcription factor [Vibrio parahaemolyticus]|uniref:helix-turn-helix transcriptional regulator n=1 Tax=Vibrio parahaemolyticus TaxID=670 RepID=UPI0006986D6C|nr:LuxR C-terminal-related transcriptional regulator [Vibrio parahaemolyticus]EGR2010870.1 DNA-binding response regulator [Vibrio parahaemolyticus]EGR2037004.1 DNA-binding response regulator [Vibrio parahaemolyticus]EGR2060823.1 DNA-binding response regulator [Vibrio parahaemolyticus]EGR2132508.1 DNA-binding response regulator [Vibrio parahaemolyticus]EGR3201794.1 DNA-binding response regulator [Vibrio parahaemolyticus]
MNWSEVNRNFFYIYSLQTTGIEFFKVFLKREFDADVNYIPVNEKINISECLYGLVYLLVDIRYANLESYTEFITEMKSVDKLRILYFNFCATKNNIKLLCRTPNFWGVFEPHDTIESISFGLRQVLTDNKWIDNRVLLAMVEEMKEYYPKLSTLKKDGSIKLTKRQVQILKLIKIGASNADVALELNISENTVKAHIHALFKKIGVKNRVQALKQLDRFI